MKGLYGLSKGPRLQDKAHHCLFLCVWLWPIWFEISMPARSIKHVGGLLEVGELILTRCRQGRENSCKFSSHMPPLLPLKTHSKIHYQENQNTIGSHHGSFMASLSRYHDWGSSGAQTLWPHQGHNGGSTCWSRCSYTCCLRCPWWRAGRMICFWLFVSWMDWVMQMGRGVSSNSRSDTAHWNLYMYSFWGWEWFGYLQMHPQDKLWCCKFCVGSRFMMLMMDRRIDGNRYGDWLLQPK